MDFTKAYDVEYVCFMMAKPALQLKVREKKQNKNIFLCIFTWFTKIEYLIYLHNFIVEKGQSNYKNIKTNKYMYKFYFTFYF